MKRGKKGCGVRHGKGKNRSLGVHGRERWKERGREDWREGERGVAMGVLI